MGVNQNGYISAVRVDGGVKSAHFAIFIQGIQAPPGTVILMDNASIHNTHAVRDAISQKQFVMLFVPPYSPDFNPIENMFSMVKNAFRRDYEHEPIRTFGDSIAGILQSLDRRKIAHCFEHAQKIVTAALDST
jgi:transposase